MGHAYATKEALAIGINLNEGANTVTPSNAHQHANVVTYENGECFYTYRIVHADDNDSNNLGIMEYGIVRNNIYRITINSFSGLGNPDPEPPVLITRNIECTIWVTPWNVIENPEIIL